MNVKDGFRFCTLVMPMSLGSGLRFSPILHNRSFRARLPTGTLRRDVPNPPGEGGLGECGPVNSATLAASGSSPNGLPP